MLLIQVKKSVKYLRICKVCEVNKVPDEADLPVCIECALIIYDNIRETVEHLNYNIKNTYDFIEMEYPEQICTCGTKSTSLLLFDYYTEKNTRDKYELVLCGKCRVCGGYREIQGINNDVFAVPLKKPGKYIGLSIIAKEKQDWRKMFG